ncbi:DNA-binding transcriptional regulator YhcF (GntR family) [Peptoniphilus koenoeneniae]|uniref:DNA-binding transcriptional regulator YhcF (GntR family) n=1 Tax=Peptoniphilus koenoeneniae TaxID=507751 RepID=A0ABU0AVY8_9FIRM|nr:MULTISPECIES: GntR family transcriptional regulator [Peptoniphilus]ERT57504.1 transcriptional regulator, GntR family [Peptoniphilus sp. BV3C26]MDQ0275428.1 DNA-binding transcriptional regulator YhcF (GntR family) [Peptoniphilus koenoeneniae]
MIIKIDSISQIPIYLQLRNEIVRGLGLGLLERGEELPAIRKIADELNINPMTVQKTFNILKAEGFIEIDRRSGARIYRDGNLKDKNFIESLRNQVIEAKARGYSFDDILKVLEEVRDV